MRVIRDRVTKELRAMWDLQINNGPTMVVEPNVDQDDEVVDLPNMTRGSAMRLARSKANGPPGRIFVHNDRVDVELPAAPTPITDKIRDNRRDNDISPNAAITLEEFQQAEREVNRGYMG